MDWNKAKVPVTNTNIGVLGDGTHTNVINVYKNSVGTIHDHQEQQDK